MKDEIILKVENLKQYFVINKHLTIKAVDDVSFQIRKGEVFGLVGETGSGKSTVARTIMGIYPPTDGKVFFKGYELTDKKSYHQNKEDIQKNIQYIFQDSAASLNPRMTVEKIIAEPLKVTKTLTDKQKISERIDELLEQVGLDKSYRSKYPGELSGGQRQRVAIARSLSVNPDLIIADEPIASLDISIQAQIIGLFQDLQKKYGFTFLFIAHDLAIIRYITSHVGVMYQGKLLEVGDTEKVFQNPQHNYTKALLSAVPVPDPVYERNKIIMEFAPNDEELNGEMAEVEEDHFAVRQ